MSAAEQVFREVDVAGDGNCFYRALYKAAKYHPDAGVFRRVLDCFDIEELVPVPVSNSNSNSSSEGKGRSKAKAKTKKARAKAKVVTDEAEETAFAAAIREQLAAKVKGDLFSIMNAAGAGNTYEAWHSAAAEALGGEEARWNALIEEASEQLAEVFSTPEIMLSMEQDDFKGLIASIIRNDGVYASELDFTLIKFLLQRCGITLMTIDLRPDRPENVGNLRVESDGKPVLIVRRMRAMDHYRAIITDEQFAAHKGSIYPAKSAAKVTLSGLRKLATAKKPKSAGAKSRKSKGAAAASNNNNNNNGLAAALAASLKNK